MKSCLRFVFYVMVLCLLSVIFGGLDAAPREPKDEILLEHVRTEAELTRILDDSRGQDGVLRLDRIQSAQFRQLRQRLEQQAIRLENVR